MAGFAERATSQLRMGLDPYGFGVHYVHVHSYGKQGIQKLGAVSMLVRYYLLSSSTHTQQAARKHVSSDMRNPPCWST